ncbi:MAG: hypothetical protein ACFE7E_03725 [Candidatus Hodarchaeota archaeon]
MRESYKTGSIGKTLVDCHNNLKSSELPYDGELSSIWKVNWLMIQIIEALLNVFSATVWVPWVLLTAVVYRYRRSHPTNPILSVLYCSIFLTIAQFFFSLDVILGALGYGLVVYIKLFSIFNLLGTLFWMRVVIYLVSPNHKERIMPQFVCWFVIVILEITIVGNLYPLENITLFHDVLIVGYLIASFSISSFFLIRLNRKLENKTLKRNLKMLIAGTLFPSLVHFFADIYAINQILSSISTYFATITAWLFSLLLYFGVVFKGEDIFRLFSFEGTIALDPTIRDCRVYALLTNYTSPEETCKFYEPNIRSKCRLDPLVFRRDCRGVVFIEGFACHQIRYHVEKEED